MKHLCDGEEAWGEIGDVQEVDSETVLATIGGQEIYLPAGLRLPSGRVGVLRIEDEYRVRRLDTCTP